MPIWALYTFSHMPKTIFSKFQADSSTLRSDSRDRKFQSSIFQKIIQNQYKLVNLSSVGRIFRIFCQIDHFLLKGATSGENSILLKNQFEYMKISSVTKFRPYIGYIIFARICVKSKREVLQNPPLAMG